jgi:predicted lysophospholipase L1 biosynthesis ABC-type transport system permease subunit
MPFRKASGPEASDEPRISNLCYVTGEFFDVLRIPLLEGRQFRNGDGANGVPVAIVNRAFVETYYSEEIAIGSYIKIGSSTHEIIGIVGNVQQQPGWGDFGPLAPMPLTYIPAAQTSDGFLRVVHTWFSPSWIVRTAGTPRGLIPGMRAAVEAVDPQLPFSGFQSLEEIRSDSISEQRFQATLFTLLAGMALLLASIGIYGLVAHAVSERARELSLRLALGATRVTTIGTAVLPAITLTAIGVIVGVALATLATRVLRHMIWGVSPGDPLTVLVAAIGLILVAAVASLIPSMRIVRLNPAETLRNE